jgi:hypothetical protein
VALPNSQPRIPETSLASPPEELPPKIIMVHLWEKKYLKLINKIYMEAVSIWLTTLIMLIVLYKEAI